MAATPLGTQAQDPLVCGTEDGTGCAPLEARVDLDAPTFSEPTRFTNPLHPSSSLRSGVMLGLADGEPFRVEITLLPATKDIEIDGVVVPAMESQYVAFLDGRIQEVALDWFAQADDGSVWYLGEDVFNYEDGRVADTEGTWQAGRDAPPAMIMPADPQIGDVYRPENAPGVVFEEVTVTRTDLEVEGPSGPVSGAIEVDELHMDGGHERKLFAPGYGEFSTGSGNDIEALALAVPTDALGGPVPAELAAIGEGARAIRDAAAVEDWPAAAGALTDLRESWEAIRTTGVPPLLESAMTDAIDALAVSVDGHEPLPTRAGAIDVARLGLDLELRHRDPAGVDVDRFGLWLDELSVDADGREELTVGRDKGPMLSDVAALEWTRDRLAEALDEADLRTIDDGLRRLRSSIMGGDLAAADKEAAELGQLVAGIAID